MYNFSDINPNEFGKSRYRKQLNSKGYIFTPYVDLYIPVGTLRCIMGESIYDSTGLIFTGEDIHATCNESQISIKLKNTKVYSTDLSLQARPVNKLVGERVVTYACYNPKEWKCSIRVFYSGSDLRITSIFSPKEKNIVNPLTPVILGYNDRFFFEEEDCLSFVNYCFMGTDFTKCKDNVLKNLLFGKQLTFESAFQNCKFSNNTKLNFIKKPFSALTYDKMFFGCIFPHNYTLELPPLNLYGNICKSLFEYAYFCKGFKLSKGYLSIDGMSAFVETFKCAIIPKDFTLKDQFITSEGKTLQKDALRDIFKYATFDDIRLCRCKDDLERIRMLRLPLDLRG